MADMWSSVPIVVLIIVIQLALPCYLAYDAHAEDRQRAMAAGFDQYLAKPVDPAALASTVKALVAIGNRQLAECTDPGEEAAR